MISTKQTPNNYFFNMNGFAKSVLLILAFIGIQNLIQAQATLSVQGILKKSNGVALEDGTYNMKFNIYAVDGTPAGILWDEIIADVELNGGIYNVILGENMSDPLNLTFDQDYEMGVQIGSQEMTPRIRLTSAPYALALRGSSNQFPSAGQVLADELKVADGVLASGGAPGLNGVNKNGYAFSGGSGDNDSGLFSTADGEVSLYINNTERVEVKDGGTIFTHPVTATNVGANQINLNNNGGINYSTSNGGNYLGWRLADVDNIETSDPSSGIDGGWKAYGPPSGENIGWNGTSGVVPCLCGPSGSTAFVGNMIIPTNNNQVLKKQFTIPGSFSHIMVKFRYYIIDSWDNEVGFAGFSSDLQGTNFRIGWFMPYYQIHNYANFGSSAFIAAANFRGESNWPDTWVDVEMTARANGNSFYVFIGTNTTAATNDETYGVGPIEIWVR